MDIKCPSCGFDNLEGEDRCQQCLHSLMQRDIPHPKKDDQFQQALLTKPVSELLTGEDLLVCSPGDTVQKILRTFQKFKKNCVLVYSRKKMVGILSNRDLSLRVAGRYKDLAKVKVEEVMTKNPGFVRAEDPIAFAVNKMAMGGYRHVPVLRADGTPVSILLIKDVLRYLSVSKKSY
jgi:CBS domain-containing protein